MTPHGVGVDSEWGNVPNATLQQAVVGLHMLVPSMTGEYGHQSSAKGGAPHGAVSGSLPATDPAGCTVR